MRFVNDGPRIAFIRGMECPHCLKLALKKTQTENQIVRSGTIKQGFYFRASDNKMIQRFRCQICKKVFSSETTHICKYQKKRHLNAEIYKLLVSGVSQRRTARLLSVNQKTIVRKFIFLGKIALDGLSYVQSQIPNPVTDIVFDDMETFEHSKCKPLSITLAVEDNTRFILGFRVSQMPAKGHLAAIARKKYGYRSDHRPKERKELFKELKSFTHPMAVIKSDENPHYVKDVKTHFSRCLHKTYKGRRGCVVGQGELKAGGFDPLFALNHTAAMLRANVNRLFRRTWNTTKKPICLTYHVALYVHFHNHCLI